MIETGTIEHDQAVNMLCDDRLHADMLPAFFRLMEKMGVAFPVTNHSVLVPTLLPSDRPNLTPELFLHPTQSCDSRVRASSDGDRPYELLPFKTVQRVYSLHSMPANFLCQLVARIKSSFDRWLSSRRRLTSGQRKRAGSASEMPYLGANHDRRYRSRIEVTQEIDTECWKNGLVSFYEGGYLLVESIDGLKRRNKRLELCGIQVTVAGDTSVLGFVIDQVETLLSDWFPGNRVSTVGSLSVRPSVCLFVAQFENILVQLLRHGFLIQNSYRLVWEASSSSNALCSIES